MKNISLLLNIILLTAVSILYFIEFNEIEETAKRGSTDSLSAQIAYINTDSLVKKYQFIIDENEKLANRTREIQQDFQNRSSGLQKEFQEYQNNRSNLTIGQAQRIEQDLSRKERELGMFQERARREISDLESEVTQELYNRITDYLKIYCDENRINVVVKYDLLSDILYAEPGLNITTDIIKGLNEEYENRRTGESSIDSTSKK